MLGTDRGFVGGGTFALFLALKNISMAKNKINIFVLCPKLLYLLYIKVKSLFFCCLPSMCSWFSYWRQDSKAGPTSLNGSGSAHSHHTHRTPGEWDAAPPCRPQLSPWRWLSGHRHGWAEEWSALRSHDFPVFSSFPSRQKNCFYGFRGNY